MSKQDVRVKCAPNLRQEEQHDVQERRNDRGHRGHDADRVRGLRRREDDDHDPGNQVRRRQRLRSHERVQGSRQE